MLADLLRRVKRKSVIANVLQARVLIATTFSSPYSPTAAAQGGKLLDRCQNGVLWTFWKSIGPSYGSSRSEIWCSCSTDNGVTWSAAVNTGFIGNVAASYALDFSIFIDLDDYCHIAYKNSNNGGLFYVRGTPNAGRTTWSWSTPLQAGGTNDYPDIVAHREGTGWVAHIVSDAGTNVAYSRVLITSGGVISLAQAPTMVFATFSTTITTTPSIDFQHNGDGKTVKNSLPHLYIGGSAPIGTGGGIRFRKMTYSAGAWSFVNPEQEIDSTRSTYNAYYWLRCLFDGTRVVLVGFLYDNSGMSAQGELKIYDRDEADTTTTARSLIAPAIPSQVLATGSATYDDFGNIYLFGENMDEATGSHDLVYRRWVRITNTLEAEIVIDAAVDVQNYNSFVNAKRGYSSRRIEFIFNHGGSSGNVTYGGIT